MSTFDTPGPISVAFEIAVGNARLVAGERGDTVVEVRPTNGLDEHDVQAAEQTKVHFSNGSLLVKTPKPKWRGRNVGSVDVTIELPAGSTVNGTGAALDVESEGRLGDCRYTAAAGQIRLDETGSLNLTTAAGTVSVRRVAGNAEVNAGSGDVRIGTINGDAVIKDSNGQIWVGEISGDLRVNTANGSIVVDKALAGVDAKSANGSVRIGEVVSGSIGLETGVGELEVGIREGTAAFLDVTSAFGAVRSSLNPTDAPGTSDETVRVRARTSFGNILIHRA